MNFVRGVRASIASIPGNTRELWNNLTAFKAVDTMRSTRNLIWDVFKNPITHTFGPILSPIVEVGKEIGRAKWQYVEGTRQAARDVVGGARRIKNAPSVATENWKMNIAQREQLADMKTAAELNEREEDYAKAGLPPMKPKIGEQSNVTDIASRRKMQSGRADEEGERFKRTG